MCRTLKSHSDIGSKISCCRILDCHGKHFAPLDKPVSDTRREQQKNKNKILDFGGKTYRIDIEMHINSYATRITFISNPFALNNMAS